MFYSNDKDALMIQSKLYYNSKKKRIMQRKKKHVVKNFVNYKLQSLKTVQYLSTFKKKKKFNN